MRHGGRALRRRTPSLLLPAVFAALLVCLSLALWGKSVQLNRLREALDRLITSTSVGAAGGALSQDGSVDGTQGAIFYEDLVQLRKSFDEPRIDLLRTGSTAPRGVRLHDISASDPAAVTHLLSEKNRAVVEALGRGPSGLSQKTKIRTFIGVFTGYTTRNDTAKYVYEERRAALRATWFPGSVKERKR